MKPDQISQAIAKASVGLNITADARRSLAALCPSVPLSEEMRTMLKSGKWGLAATGQMPALPRTISSDLARATGATPRPFGGTVALSEEMRTMLKSGKWGLAATGQMPALPRTPVKSAPAVALPEEVDFEEDAADLPELRSKPLPEEVGEVLASHLARSDREAAMDLFTDIGQEEARLHLEAVEERLLHGTRPAHLHAALSASLLLRGLADRLFPARKGEVWTSRFDSRHTLGSTEVGNRLSAFVDSRIRSHLSTRQHLLFQATLDAVLGWAGEGHHVFRDATNSARAFRQLLEVLAMVARAYRSPAAPD